MTNEEAFEKFWEDRQAKGLDAANRREYEESWQAAIAYMQEQSEPLKRLDEITIDEIFSTYTDEQGYVAIDDWHLLTNAIMDEMERLNKL